MSVLKPDIIQNKNVFALNEALDQVPGVVVVDEDPQIRAGSGRCQKQARQEGNKSN
jgi:hypothetical protein